MTAKVRSNSDILTEGTGEDYGWVSNATHGDFDPGGHRPEWWVGSDQFNGQPIGPNGPDPGYGWDIRGAWRNRNWWNAPQRDHGILSAVTRCTTVIVNPIIRTPWQVFDADGVKPLPSWITDPCRRSSVPGQSVFDSGDSVMPWGMRLSSHEFWQTVLTHAIWFGRGAFICQEDSAGRPLAGSLMLINPYLIHLEDGYWVFNPGDGEPLRTDFDGRFRIGGVSYRLYVMRGLPPNNSTRSEGVLERHFDTLKLGVAIHTYQYNSFGNGVPPGYLKVGTPNFDDAKAAKLKSDWMAAHGGDSKSIAVLNSQVEFTPISIRPVDNETTSLKQSHLVDVAHSFGLSAAWVDASAGYSLTYSNVTDRRRELLDISLTGWGQQLMEMLGAALAYNNRIRIEWDRFTAPNLAEQIGPLVNAVNAGIMTVDEARTRMGLVPLGMEQESRV